MQKYAGKSVSKGTAAGKIRLYARKEAAGPKRTVEDVQAELARFEEARREAEARIEGLYEKALKEAGEEQAMIFEVHRMMLEDADYLEAVRSLIREEKADAEYAVRTAGEQFARMFSELDNDYMKQRSADVLDVSRQVAGILAGGEEAASWDEPVILLARDLSPSETMQLDKDKILAFALCGGSANSHTAILARSLNIPALVQTQVELKEEYDGKQGAVDGFSGVLYVEPDEETLSELHEREERQKERRERLEQLKGLKNETRDGRRVEIYANIGSAEEVEKVLESDAGGIGLFRSEFLYLGRDDYPTEEEQFEIYKEVLSRMGGKKVVIRTLDIGADKQADYFGLPREENPALGYRAIRICLTRRDVFTAQLRAIYRASAYGRAAVMFPMVISVEEVRKIKEIVEEVKKELSEEGKAVGEVELGIMVETPAAAIISDRLAEEVDFFSLGTNDLTQYTLAIDRQNQRLEEFFDAHHEAVLRLIELTVKNAHAAGIWAGICGDLAADESLTERFLEMGVDELSVAPSSVLSVREAVRNI